jgi:hypothetical protein
MFRSFATCLGLWIAAASIVAEDKKDVPEKLQP